jgi:hypothetical protein
MSLMRLNVQFLYKQDCLIMQWAASERAWKKSYWLSTPISNNKKRKASSYIEMFLMMEIHTTVLS